MYYLFIQIINLKYTPKIRPLFEATIIIMHAFSKNHGHNKKILQQCVYRFVELISELNLTQLLCEILSNHRINPIGRRALSLVFELIDDRGCTNDFLRFLRGFMLITDDNYMESLQIDIMKSVFNSKGIKAILGNENQDIFSPQFFLETEGNNQHLFVLHIEIIKVIIACSVKNSFGILQGRKLITVNSLKSAITKSDMIYFGKEAYLRYLELVYLTHINGEVEPEGSINNLDNVLIEAVLPDLMKFKDYIQPIIKLARRGVYKEILKKRIDKQQVKLSPDEEEVLNY